MYKIRGNPIIKGFAIVLFLLMVAAFAASALGLLLIFNYDLYDDGYDKAMSRAMEEAGWTLSHQVSRNYMGGSSPEEIEDAMDIGQSNFRFEIYDDGAFVYSNYKNEETIASCEYTNYYFVTVPTEPPVEESQPALSTPTPAPVDLPDGWESESAAITQGVTEDPVPSPTPTPQPTAMPSNPVPILEEQQIEVRVIGFVLKDMAADDALKTDFKAFQLLFSLSPLVWMTAAGSLLVGFVLFVFLLSAAGRRKNTEGVTPNFMDKIPFDIYTCAMAAAVICLCALLVELSYNYGDTYHSTWILLLVLMAACILAIALLALMFCMSLATRIKLGEVLKNTLVYKVWAWCWKKLKALGTLLLSLLRGLPLIKRSAMIIGAVLLMELLVICAIGNGENFLAWLIERAIIVPALIYVLLCMHRLREGAKKIAAGDISGSVDTKHMYGELKAHADDLNNIRGGVQRAVNERMKSERFKTELITNVSHDIKTPLTSIINYVDLLSKEETENEKARGYIDILQRQSARLKKLTEDLVEASKASTGNLNVNLERCELGVLLDQTTGEYVEKLAEKGLELVVRKPESPVFVMADSRHLWRIFDNLMNNICKYSQPLTRVYLDLTQQGLTAQVSFRNISKYQLNISGDELMERFVRGDSSRNTEGSGLGLSIARSLAQLQGASLDLIVDGDLFKVVISFDTVN